MKYILALIACVLVTTAWASTSDPAADAINHGFDMLLLILDRAKGLIEPIVGLAVAVMIAMQYVSLRHQRVAASERKDQTAVLSDQTATLNQQNQVLAHVTEQVQTVKESVNGLTTQAVSDARVIGKAEGIASVVDPVVAEHKAIVVLSVAADEAKSVVSDAAATAKETLNEAADKLKDN
jgi:hypothetical protein